MNARNPFVRENDEHHDTLMAEIYYVVTNIHKKWGYSNSFDPVIETVVFRGEAPWHGMDVRVRTARGRFGSHVGEFLEHFHPEGVEKFDANALFRKLERHYGIEYEIDVDQD